MRRAGLAILALWLLLPATAWSYDLLIVQSQRSPVYDELLRGIRSVARFSERIVVLTDYNDIDLQRIAREESPIAIVTLGDTALAATGKVRQTPVIALMSLNYRSDAMRQRAMTGVEVQIPPERYLALFAAIKAKKVGIINHAARSAAYVRRARIAAAGYGIELVVREVRSSKEVPGQLESLTGQVDALWMLPDSVTASGEAADAHLLFSAGNKVPVVTFASAYLAAGAALALEIDPFDMGKQAGVMAASLLEGDSIADIAAELPRKSTVKSNPSVLRRLGLNPDAAYNRNSKLLP